MLTFFDLVDISEKYMEIVNPSSADKLQKAGAILGLQPGQQVIDFGCGFGETLALWADKYGINGIGIDVRENACERATNKLAGRNLSERIQIVCADASKYDFSAGEYDCAICIGATFIWEGGFRQTIQTLKRAAKPGGRLVIGEATWKSSLVPPQVAIKENFATEQDLLKIIGDEGYDLMYMIHASPDDWDRYEADNWYGLTRWLDENPGHPDWDQVADHLHRSQEEYLTIGREFYQWGLYILTPHSSR
jgi:ubiquinone/menaquinone biosynthesis C-methylase UbiE